MAESFREGTGTRTVDARVLEFCRDMLEAPDLALDDDLFAAGATSLSLVQLVVELHVLLELEFSADAAARGLAKARTARALANYCDNLRRSATNALAS